MLLSNETISIVYKKVSFFSWDSLPDQLDFFIEESISRLLEYEYVAKKRLAEPQRVAFLYKTATNLIIDESRKKRRLVRICQMHEEIPSEIDVSETLDKKELYITLQNTLSDLPEIYQRTLEYKYFLELSIEEIADMEGVSIAGVKKRLKTAKQILYKKLRKEFSI